MSKIESDMLHAIKRRKSWKSSNTEVFINDKHCALVYLHGNLIATVSHNRLQLFDGNWRTSTTKSRLNAIINGLIDGTNNGVYQKDSKWYLTSNGEDYLFDKVSHFDLI